MCTNKLRILVVEDHADTMTALGRLLGRLGYQPAKAASADEALRIARCEPFDVLLVDVDLGGTDSWQLLHELASLGIHPPRTVTMSAGTSPVNARYSRLVGCYTHLCKPFDIQQLEAALR